MSNTNGTHPSSNGTLALFSVSHHHAPVEIREQLAFDDEQRAALLRDLKQIASEAVSITTCNRTELYLLLEHHGLQTMRHLNETVARHGGVDPRELAAASRCQTDDDSIRHLFRVASGLDSAILGEPQILGQVRDAMLEAHEQDTSGPILERMFQRALATGKRARSRTGISRGAGSISHAAVKLAQDTVGNLSDKRAVTVGLGEMGCLVARNLYANGVGSIDVCNRTMERAEITAREIGGQAIPWSQLESAVRSADIVITATGSEEYVLTLDHLRPTNCYDSTPTLIIDISVPRNVDPQVDSLPHVQLFDIDALHAVQTRGIEQRRAEIPKVEAIVNEELQEFCTWFSGRRLAPVISDLYSQASSIQHVELEKALRRLSHLDERDKEVVRAMAYGITQKMLHKPVTRLKSASETDDHASMISKLFDIPYN